MKTNEELQRDVQASIKWERLLNAAEIGVTAKDGVVTLTGIVDNYVKKLEAENATRKVLGVKAVVEKIEVVFSNNGIPDDNEIATDVLNVFKRNLKLPEDKIKIKIEAGWITLEGELEWNYQKEEALRTITNIKGVKGVSNNLIIKSEIYQKVEQKDIENALRRNWSIDDRNINVKVSDHSVTLSGTVSSWYQKEEAARIAWNAPGICKIDNELVVDYDEEDELTD